MKFDYFKQALANVYLILNLKCKKQKNKLKDKIMETPIKGDFDCDKWKNIFINFLKEPLWDYEIDNIESYFDGFSKEPIELVKYAKTKDDFSGPVVICAEKNNLIYLKELLPYYRNLGVSHFVFIDNDSNDQSYNFLLKQEDVTLFKAPYKFNGLRKVGWKLQALATIGLNHWYLWLDSDEFIVYKHMEEKNLCEYIEELDKRKVINVGGFMLDMYPDDEIMNGKNNDDFITNYKYFDKDNQYYVFNNDNLFGGMRNRTLGLNNIRLDKTPLIYCKEDNLPFGNHDTLKKRIGITNNFGCVLKHYKFIPNSKDIFIKRATANDSGYANKTAQEKYANLIEKNLMCDLSQEYKDSSSLDVFPYLKDFLKG